MARLGRSLVAEEDRLGLEDGGGEVVVAMLKVEEAELGGGREEMTGRRG